MQSFPCTNADIRVDWKTFNLLQEDSSLLDLIATIGDPFPRRTPTATPTRPPGRSTASGGGEEDSGDGGVVESDSTTEPGPLIRVMLRAHEGVEGDQPFTVQPTQMVSHIMHELIENHGYK